MALFSPGERVGNDGDAFLVGAADLGRTLGQFDARGYAPPDEIAEMRQALGDWGRHPQGIGIFARCEVIARKDGA
jgi:hypothetical protein